MAGAQLAHIPARQQHRISEWYLFPTFPIQRPNYELFSFPPSNREHCWLVVKVKSLSVCSNLCEPMDCSLPGFLCPWDFPGKSTGVGCHLLLWGSSRHRDWTQVSCIAGRPFTVWATREAWLAGLPANLRGSHSLKHSKMTVQLDQILYQILLYYTWSAISPCCLIWLLLRPGSANQGNSYFLSQPSALLSPLIEFLKSSSAHIRPVAISLEDSSSYISGFYFINSHHWHYTPISTNNFSWPFLAQTSRPFLVCGGETPCNTWNIPWPGIEPRSPALGVWNLDHWTTWAVRSLPLMSGLSPSLSLSFYNLSVSMCEPLLWSHNS